MSYNPNIPVITDSILLSSRQIRANFQAIQQAFANNHFPLSGDSTLAGKHNVLTFRPQSGDPTTSATQIALYTKLVSSIPELFYAPSSTQTPIQLTYPSIKADGSTTQYSFVAGPFIIYGGTITGTPANNTVVTLTPGTSLIYVDLTVTNNTPVPIPIPVSLNAPANSFTIKYSNPPAGSTFDVYYFAIGV